MQYLKTRLYLEQHKGMGNNSQNDNFEMREKKISCLLPNPILLYFFITIIWYRM